MGERFPLPPKGKTKRYKYGLVICIFMGCVSERYIPLLHSPFLSLDFIDRYMPISS